MVAIYPVLMFYHNLEFCEFVKVWSMVPHIELWAPGKVVLVVTHLFCSCYPQGRTYATAFGIPCYTDKEKHQNDTQDLEANLHWQALIGIIPEISAPEGTGREVFMGLQRGGTQAEYLAVFDCIIVTN